MQCGSGALRIIFAAVSLFIGLGWLTVGIVKWLTDGAAAWRSEQHDVEWSCPWRRPARHPVPGTRQ